MVVIVGIDGGLEGGISAIDREGKLLFKCVMPTIQGKGKRMFDIAEIKRIFLKIKLMSADSDMVVAIEKSQISHIGGKSSIASKFLSYGILQGLLVGMDIPYQIFRPQEWQKYVLSGIEGSDTKIRSILFCKRLFPNESWKRTERCSKDHDGMTDSLCLAYYLKSKMYK